jgi:hypothetical protein
MALPFSKEDVCRNKKSRHVYTKDHTSCQDLLPKSTEGEARTRVGIMSSPAWRAGTAGANIGAYP